MTLDPRPLRSGLTLIELLVVIIILTMLVGAAIPLLSPTNDDRRIREAARGVNAYITGAQTRAIELHRPYGVALRKIGKTTGNPQDNGACVELAYVEQPPAYTGFDQSSAARVALHELSNPSWYNGLRPLVRIQFVTRGNGAIPGLDGLPLGWDIDLFPGGVMRPGDVIEINGTQYELVSDTNDTLVVPDFDTSNEFFSSNTGKYLGNVNKPVTIVAHPLNDTGQMIYYEHDNRGRSMREFTDVAPSNITPPNAETPFWTNPSSYKILRQPMPTSAEAYQLPEGTAIDLRASGDDTGSFYVPLDSDLSFTAAVIDNDEPVIIMFAPEGTIERVRFSRRPADPIPFDDPVTSTMYLLVGRRTIIPAPQLGSDVTIDPTTAGKLVTDEQRQEAREPVNWLRGESRWIAIGPQSGRVVTTENAFVSLTPSIFNREINRNDQIKRAREFARQMTQMGGG